MDYEIDVKAMRYFVAVARYRSFSLAANALHVSQPAISRQILTMERAFNRKLFRSNGRSVVLSEAGAELHLHFQDVLQRIDEAARILREGGREPAGHLTVGLPSAVASILMPDVICSFRSRYPKVSITLTQGYSGDLAEAITAGRLDVALMFQGARHSDLEQHPIGRVEVGLISPGDSQFATRGPHVPVSLGELARLPLILPSRNNALRIAVERALAERGLALNIVLESDCPMVSLELVRRGVGYMATGVDGLAVLCGEGGLAFTPLEQPGVTLTMVVAQRLGKAGSLAVQAMAKEIDRSARKLMERGVLHATQVNV